MFRRHWMELSFWRWWWENRVPFEGKLVTGALVLVLVLGGGWFASDELTSAHASGRATSYAVETTVEKVVTVRQGTTVSKLVPVVKQVIVHTPKVETTTAIETQVVAAPGKTQTVTVSRPVTVTVSVVKWRTLTLVQTVGDTVTETVPVTVTVNAPAP